MADLFEGIRKTLEGKGKTIVLPEGEDVRILEAAVHLQQEGIITPVLLGNEEAVNKAAKDGGFDISEIKLIDPANASYFEELAEKFVERRAGKATIEQAREQLKDVNYFWNYANLYRTCRRFSEWGCTFDGRYSSSSIADHQDEAWYFKNKRCFHYDERRRASDFCRLCYYCESLS